MKDGTLKTAGKYFPASWRDQHVFLVAQVSTLSHQVKQNKLSAINSKIVHLKRMSGIPFMTLTAAAVIKRNT